MIVLGINKQLDLQSDLTWAAKIAAHKEGWYDLRRGVQGLFLLRETGSAHSRLFENGWPCHQASRD